MVVVMVGEVAVVVMAAVVVLVYYPVLIELPAFLTLDVFYPNRNRNRNLQFFRAPLRSQAQGTSLFTSAFLFKFESSPQLLSSFGKKFVLVNDP